MHLRLSKKLRDIIKNQFLGQNTDPIKVESVVLAQSPKSIFRILQLRQADQWITKREAHNLIRMTLFYKSFQIKNFYLWKMNCGKEC